MLTKAVPSVLYLISPAVEHNSFPDLHFKKNSKGGDEAVSPDSGD